jgi:hypothetical protein
MGLWGPGPKMRTLGGGTGRRPSGGLVRRLRPTWVASILQGFRAARQFPWLGPENDGLRAAEATSQSQPHSIFHNPPTFQSDDGRGFDTIISITIP